MKYFPNTPDREAKLQELVECFNDYLEWYLIKSMDDNDVIKIDCATKIGIYAHLGLEEAINCWLDHVDWHQTFENYRKALKDKQSLGEKH